MARSWKDCCLFISVRNDLGGKKESGSFSLFMELKALYIDLLQIMRDCRVYFQFQA